MFPAYAGMILKFAANNFIVFSVPRVCGDDPVTGAELVNKLKCSPRMRG